MCRVLLVSVTGTITLLCVQWHVFQRTMLCVCVCARARVRVCSSERACNLCVRACVTRARLNQVLKTVAQDAAAVRDPFSHHLSVRSSAAVSLPALLSQAASPGAPIAALAPPPPLSGGAELRAGALAGRAAVVYLTSDGEDDVVDLCHALRLVRQHWFEPLGGYPVVILHDGLSARHTRHVRAAAGADVVLHFVFVPLRAAAEAWERAAGGGRSRMRRFAQAPQHGLGYRSMCRFFAGPLVDLEIWDELRVEYILRLDTDAFFPAPLSVDPFVRLEQGRGVYGYLTTALEEPAMADGLLDAIRAGLKNLTASGFFSSPEAAGVPGLLLPPEEGLLVRGVLGGGKRDEWDGTFFYNNFELLQLAFFRSRAYRAMFTALDASGGFFERRWGDGPVRTLALGLLARPEAVVKLSAIPYWHQTAVFM